MNLKQINLDEQELPQTLTVEVTHDEAAFLLLVLGKMNGIAADAIMPDGQNIKVGMRVCLQGLFNRFYEDGVNEAIATM